MVEKIIELAKENLSIDGEITATSSFKEDLEVDSLDLMELVMALEDEFNVERRITEYQDSSGCCWLFNIKRRGGINENKNNRIA